MASNRKNLLQFSATTQLPKTETENYIWSQKYDLLIYPACHEFIFGK